MYGPLSFIRIGIRVATPSKKVEGKKNEGAWKNEGVSKNSIF